jgi:hypothetical protein
VDPKIRELSGKLHQLHEKIMETDPWEDGYGEVVDIHEQLSKVLRDAAHKSMADFKKHLEKTGKEIEEQWASRDSSLFSGWGDYLGPVLKAVESFIPPPFNLVTKLLG